jgi:hypothetical protein
VSDKHARAVYHQLQALGRAQYGGNTGALLVVYAVEGFLRRLAASPYATQMTLKGGMLMAATSARRMTKDADLSTVGIANEEAQVAEVVGDIVTTAIDADDGLIYDIASIRTEVMREEAEYDGVRVKLEAHLATARMTTTLDFSFGDPHRSVIVELPELLGRATIRLASYPPELTLAEKIATMMSRRELNTRDRDFADVWVLSRSLTLPAAPVRSAIYEVAAHRRHDVLPLSETLVDMPDRQVPYSAMLARMSYQRVPPMQWRDMVADVTAFVDPLIASADGKLTSWDPDALRWT